jgi:Zn-dependent protease with chaperone function
MPWYSTSIILAGWAACREVSMNAFLRKAIALFLCDCLLLAPVTGCGTRQAVEVPQPKPIEEGTLRAHLQESYLGLFDTAPTLRYTTNEIRSQRETFSGDEKVCLARFKDHAEQYAKQMKTAQEDLKEAIARLTDAQRKQVHCQIQNLDQLQREAETLYRHAIPTAYDNLNAKLDLIEKWPAVFQQTQMEIANESYMKRRWSNVKDIGFREIASGQEDDIKRGQEAIEELRRHGLMPPDLNNEKIQDYVNSVAQSVARHSDLRVPLHVMVLQSREINAFALPGGYLFVQRGLLEAADNETELAGVLAHEIGHVTARHGYKLIKRATIASIFYQAAQVAALVLTGGVVGPGLYYALQYGFFGLGFILDLNLLGISRDYELEADQLGVQYAWNAGYDPAGFIQFFDKMATTEGYVNGASWFRTHPPFFERMIESRREIMFLATRPDLVVQTAAFKDMKKELAGVTAQAEKEEASRPRLLITREQGCEPPRKIEYTPGQPIEELCASPLVIVPDVQSGGQQDATNDGRP